MPGQLGKGQINSYYGLANALGNIEDMDLPSLRNMVLIIGFYIFLAGLLNYLVLKKLDKREWDLGYCTGFGSGFCPCDISRIL